MDMLSEDLFICFLSFCLSFSSWSLRHRVYHIFADDEKDMQEWMKEISSLASQPTKFNEKVGDPKKSPDSTKVSPQMRSVSPHQDESTPSNSSPSFSSSQDTEGLILPPSSTIQEGVLSTETIAMMDSDHASQTDPTTMPNSFNTSSTLDPQEDTIALSSFTDGHSDSSLTLSTNSPKSGTVDGMCI